jgi:Cys-tRNA(Pro)/Cys-tRNA(Cys) deacylase
VTVLGARKDYPAYADETVELFDVISVSAGARGTQILLAPADYLQATKAKTGPLTR